MKNPIEDRSERYGRHHENVKRIALQFTRLLHVEIGTTRMDTVVALNREETSRDVCHSHDFCDANMVMHAAFVAAGFVPPLTTDLSPTYICPAETRPHVGCNGSAPCLMHSRSAPDVDNAATVQLWNDAWSFAVKHEFDLARMQ